jgi:DNA-binding ferritin-like protein
LTNCHWLARGDNFYGNHLLFERVYQELANLADISAERFIGVFGSESVSLSEQAKMIAKLLAKYQDDNLLAIALRFHKDILNFSDQLFNDMLASSSSKIEENIYLLERALEENEGSN